MNHRTRHLNHCSEFIVKTTEFERLQSRLLSDRSEFIHSFILAIAAVGNIHFESFIEKAQKRELGIHYKNHAFEKLRDVTERPERKS